MTERNRFFVLREQSPRYAVGGTQAARWSVCDRWNDGKPVGFGIRQYEATNIASWLNNRNQTSPLPKHLPTEPYWEWRQPGDYFFVRFPHITRANHKTSLLGSFVSSSKKAFGP